MDRRITAYTVGGLARLSGVTVRTLHHFDRIGLLVPGRSGTARYRRYGAEDLLRLQEILVWRAAGLPLAEIGVLLDSPGDRLARLSAHLTRIDADLARLAAVRATLAATIDHLTKGHPMTERDLFAGFPPEEQAAHERWLIARGGAAMADAIARSKQAVAGAPGGIAALNAARAALEARLAGAMAAGLSADSASLHALLEEHRALMARFWGRDCPGPAYAGLGQMYLEHEGFAAHFEPLGAGLTAWLAAAMAAHADRLAG